MSSGNKATRSVSRLTLSADGLVTIPLATGLGAGGKSRSVTVKLAEADTAGVPSCCSWLFESVPGSVSEARIDLGRLDSFSATLSDGTREHLADRFELTRDFSLKRKITVEVKGGGAAAGDVIVKEELSLPLPLRDALAQRGREGAAPTIEWFFLELTNSCNFHCRWCPQSRMSRPTGRMSLENAKTLLADIKSYRDRRPIISFYSEIRNPVFLHVMGEPLLHRHFFEIVEYGHRLGLTFCLVTNTSLLTPDTVTRLIDSGIEGIVLSLNACDDQSFAAAGAPVSYATCVERARGLISERLKSGRALPRIEIQLLNTKNVKLHGVSAVEKEEQVERALVEWSLFVREQERRFGTQPYPSDPEALRGWRSSLDEKTVTVGRYFPIGQEISLVFKSACNFGNVLLPPGHAVDLQMHGSCPFRNAHKTLCVFWDGSCSYCTLDYDASVELGNAFEEGIESVWSGEKMTRIRACMDGGVLSEKLCRRCQGVVRRS